MTASSSTCANGIQLTFKMRVKMQLTTFDMVQQQDLRNGDKLLQLRWMVI